jgi:hypothetical protein
VTSPSTGPTSEDLPTGSSGAEQTSEQKTRSNRGKLERAWAKRRLIIDLAKGESTERELATKYGVAPSSINEFKQRHIDDVEAYRQDLENEFVGLWIAQKTDRLAEHQALYEDGVSPRDRETRAMLLRHAAEELGQIPNRTTIDMASPVEVKLIGVDLDDV